MAVPFGSDLTTTPSTLMTLCVPVSFQSILLGILKVMLTRVPGLIVANVGKNTPPADILLERRSKGCFVLVENTRTLAGISNENLSKARRSNIGRRIVLDIRCYFAEIEVR